MSQVLVVDDDPVVSDVVSRYLVREGHEVVTVADGLVAIETVRARPPDLVVLDLMLPTVNGLDVCRAIQQITPTPVIMLTARDGEGDRVAGLTFGADDYVTKPFSPRELVLRVDAVLRRTSPQSIRARPVVLRDDDLLLDDTAHEVTLAGASLTVTAREYELLRFLMQRPGVAFTREQLFAQVWGWTFGDSSTVTVHVRRLREKIEAVPSKPERIVTVWGVGYRYEPREPA